MGDQVKVLCRVPNGVTISRFKEGFDDGTGKKTIIRSGARVTLNGPSSLEAGTGDPGAKGSAPGVTMVDREWIEAWLKENAETDMVRGGHIEIAAQDPAEEPSDDPDHPAGDV